MWAALASAAASVAGSLINSRNARQQYAEQKAALDQQKAENAAWYNRRYYEDGTQRGDVQRALTKAQDTLRRENQAAAGRAAVMGGTNAEAAATKEANSQAYADMVSNASAAADARKDLIENSYRTMDAGLNAEQRGLDLQARQEKASAVSNAVQAVGTVAGSIEQGNAARGAVSRTAGNAAGTGAGGGAGTGGGMVDAGNTTIGQKPFVDTFGARNVMNDKLNRKVNINTPSEKFSIWSGAKRNILK